MAAVCAANYHQTHVSWRQNHNYDRLQESRMMGKMCARSPDQGKKV